ncbi:MAG: flavin reductase family protein [Pontiellaceae bacterium]|nr:flavin reductase family protein [Pontiellaceae bacterium]MBN2783375.1 flavin reductase family protein [Pontiellaceae bacterium]
MELDFDTPELADRVYPILASLVTPRPIALVSTIDSEGRVNAAPFSFFNLFGAKPPICAFAPGNRDDGTPKDTALNIQANSEFVINLVDEALAEGMNRCAASLPFGESELKCAGLTTTASTTIKPPCIAEAPVSLECKTWDILEIGHNRMVIGLIQRVHLRDELYDAEKQRVLSEKIMMVGRMASPHWYCRTRDRFELIRPE